MIRNRLVHVIPVALLVSAAIWGAHAADRAQGAAVRMSTGAYAINFHINAPSTVPDGATVMCKASVAPHSAKPARLSPSVESDPGFAVVSGSSANCVVRLPLAFTASDAQNAAALSYEIDAFTQAGQAFKRTQQNIAVAYPETPSKANLTLNVNF